MENTVFTLPETAHCCSTSDFSQFNSTFIPGQPLLPPSSTPPPSSMRFGEKHAPPPKFPHHPWMLLRPSHCEGNSQGWGGAGTVSQPHLPSHLLYSQALPLSLWLLSSPLQLFLSLSHSLSLSSLVSFCLCLPLISAYLSFFLSFSHIAFLCPSVLLIFCLYPPFCFSACPDFVPLLLLSPASRIWQQGRNSRKGACALALSIPTNVPHPALGLPGCQGVGGGAGGQGWGGSG